MDVLFFTFMPCILRNYLIYFENRLSYFECIVMGAQKGRITMEFARDPHIK